MNSCELMQHLRTKHDKLKWAFLEEVPNGTGGHKSRTADALAMSIWPSNGLTLHGFELKVSRSDWQKEMQQISKSEAFSTYCDFWWLVSPPEVARLEEIPANWGWYVPAGESVKVRKMPTRNEQPVPISRAFLASIFRVTQKTDPTKEAKAAAYKQGFDIGYARAKSESTTSEAWELKRLQQDYAKLKESIDRFQQISGVPLASYNGAELGEIVHFIKTFGLKGLRTTLKQQLEDSERKLAWAHRTHVENQKAVDQFEELLKEQLAKRKATSGKHHQPDQGASA